MSSISELYREIRMLETRNGVLRGEISEYEERKKKYAEMRMDASEDWNTCIEYVGEMYGYYECSVAFQTACANDFSFYQQNSQQDLMLSYYDLIGPYIDGEVKKRKTEIKNNDRQISWCYREIEWLESDDDD